MKPPSAAEVLRALPEASRPAVKVVLAAANAQGFAVYLVGGPVRDLLMGRPLRDVDLIVEQRKGEGAKELARAAAFGDARVRSHARFGTVALQLGDTVVDLATVRRESYAHDGALPKVEPGTLEEDLRRRDFTINALALPFSAGARARHRGVVDCVGGLEDLERRRLRVLHPRSFHDDPTRALRGARFAPRLGFALTRGSRTALRDALRDGAVGRVSGDRLRREIVKLFEDAAVGLDPARALRLLADWHVLGALEPGLALAPTAVAPLRRLGRSLASPPWPAARWRPWVAGLALWLAPLAPILRRRTLRRFAVRGEAFERVHGFATQRETWLRALARARGRGAIDAVLGRLGEEELQALFASAPPAERRRVSRYANEDRARRPPVNGRDLLGMGLAGPAIGRALMRIRSAYLDGAVKSREEAIALARELVQRKGAGAARRRAGSAGSRA